MSIGAKEAQCWVPTYQWDDLCRFLHQLVGKVFIVLDQVADVDVAVEFLQKRILAQLVS